MTRRSAWRMRQKVLMDIVEESKNAYKGRFWNHYIDDFQSWNENQKWLADFESFCSRMWLDHEEENLTIPAAGNRLSKNEYINKYEDWLVKKFLEKNENE